MAHPDGAVACHLHPFLAKVFDPTFGQASHHWKLRLEPLLPSRATPSQQVLEKLLVILTTRKIWAASQNQFLFHGLLETMMHWLDIPVLVGLAGLAVGSLQPVVIQRLSIPFGELLRGYCQVNGLQTYGIPK
jgi:hypothetical protein